MTHLYLLQQAAKLVLDGEWQLPHFQRPYVWTKKKQAALFTSLIEGFPTGSLLLWKRTNKKGPSIPFDFSAPIVIEGSAEFLVIDGQQRLTTLVRQFLLARRPISEWGQFDGRSTGVIEFDLRHKNPAMGIRLLIPKKTAQLNSYVYQRSKVTLPGLLHDNFEQEIIEHLRSERHRKRAREIRQRFLDRPILVDYLPTASNIEQAMSAFERINSEGTRLGIVDVAAAQLFFSFEGLSAQIKKFHAELISTRTNPKAFSIFSLNLLIRSILFEIYGTANPATARNRRDKKAERKAIVSAWESTKKAFKELKQFLVSDLKLNSSEVLGGGTLALLVASRAFTIGSLRSPVDRNRLKAWLFMALLFKPYSGTSTNSNVDKDLRIIAAKKIDWNSLTKNIQKNVRGGGSLQILASDFFSDGAPPSKKHVYHHLMWLLAHDRAAIDWITGAPIPSIHPDSAFSSWDRHHIFPQRLMKEQKQTSQTNRLGNLAWLSESSNRIYIRDRKPNDYLRRVRLSEYGPEALAAQSIPNDSTIYDSASKFIKRREEMLADDMNNLLLRWRNGESSRFDVQATSSKAISKVIGEGKESQTVEFKSTFRVDAESDVVIPAVEHALVKAIVSMANSGGGTVFIGVADDGKIVGTSREEAVLRKRSKNGRAELPNLITDCIRRETLPKGKDSLAKVDYLQISTERVKGQQVVVCRVFQTPVEIWMRKRPTDAEHGDRGPWVVFQRAGASTVTDTESTDSDPTQVV
jgi:hypothetical protein